LPGGREKAGVKIQASEYPKEWKPCQKGALERWATSLRLSPFPVENVVPAC